MGFARSPIFPNRRNGSAANSHLQLALGRVLIDHEGADSEAVRATFERARELCLALDEVERSAAGLRRTRVELSFHPFAAGKDHSIHQRDDRGAPTNRRPSGVAHDQAGRSAWRICCSVVSSPRARRCRILVDMYDLDRDGPNAGMSTRDPKVSTCTLLGICLTILGYPDSGAAMSLAGVQHAETLNHAISLNLGLRRACVQAMLQRDIQSVIEFSDQLAALRADYETYKGSWEGTFFHDWAQLCTRPDPVLFDRMQTFLHHLDATRNWALLPFYMASAAELSGRYGDVAAAAALLERAAEIVNSYRRTMVRGGDHPPAGSLRRARPGGGQGLAATPAWRRHGSRAPSSGSCGRRSIWRGAARRRKHGCGAGRPEAGLRVGSARVGQRQTSSPPAHCSIVSARDAIDRSTAAETYSPHRCLQSPFRFCSSEFLRSSRIEAARLPACSRKPLT